MYACFTTFGKFHNGAHIKIRSGFPLAENFLRSGTERNGTEKLVSVHEGHVSREIFCSVLFKGKLNQVQLFLSFLAAKILEERLDRLGL